MTPREFAALRAHLRLSQAAFAEEIGTSLRTVQYLEVGRDSRGNELAEIPKTIALACRALGLGIRA